MTDYNFDDLPFGRPFVAPLGVDDRVFFHGGPARLAAVVYTTLNGAPVTEVAFLGQDVNFLAELQVVAAKHNLIFDDGSNLLIGGPGSEGFTGSPLSDALYGGDGADTLDGLGGDNFLHGNQGDDRLTAGAGADTMLGGQGADFIRAGLDLPGEAGNFAHGNLGADTVIGGAGDDILLGGQGDDSIQAGGGADAISGDRGSDTLSGGAGGDSFFVAPNGGDDRILDFNGAEGDRVHVQAGTGLEFHQVGADTLILVDHGGSTITLLGVQVSGLDPEWFVTDGGTDSGGDTIVGSDVTDVLIGGLGNDSILGGAGSDWITGNLGDDTLVGGGGGDAFFETAHSGDDRVLDFNGAEGDRVRIEAGRSFEVHQDGADTLILVDHGSSTMRLVGVQAATLHADWIVGV